MVEDMKEIINDQLQKDNRKKKVLLDLRATHTAGL